MTGGRGARTGGQDVETADERDTLGRFPGHGAEVLEVRAGHWWQAFTGLVPVLVMVPVLLAHAYAAGVLLAAAGGLLVAAFHLSRRQGVSSLDVLALAFAALNVAIFFGLHSTVLIRHLDVVFYTLLAAQASVSLRWGSPWTSQFTRRTVVRALWETPAFVGMNRLTTRIWAAAFLAADLAAVALPEPPRVWVPVAVLALTVALSRRAGRRHLARRLAGG